MTKADWVKIWMDDKESMLETMRRNLASDIEVGYDLYGYTIQQQIHEIEEYKKAYDRDAELIKSMDVPRARHWCYVDLRKRGVIDEGR